MTKKINWTYPLIAFLFLIILTAAPVFAAGKSDIIKAIEKMDMLRGSGEIKCLDTEMSARQNARRSIVSAVDIPRGTVITEEMLTYKRPGSGIAPSRMPELIGKTALTDIPEDTILQEQMISNE